MKRRILFLLKALVLLPVLPLMMVAAPQQGTLMLRFANGATKCVNVYASDVVNALTTYGTGGKAVAGGPDQYTFPQNGVITDLVWVTGLTDTAYQIVNRDNSPTGDVMQAAIQDDGITFRPSHNIPFAAGQRLSMTQVA